MSDIASWVGALGTLGAVIAAVVLWRADRSHEKNERVRDEKQRVQRMIVALRAEIQSAITVAKRQKYTIERTLAEVDKALQSGGAVMRRDQLREDSMTITDAIVFRATAPELGRLPAEIIRNITEFYTLTRELERIALMGDAMTVYRQIDDLLPRLLMHGAMILRIFDRFLGADCAPGVNLKLPKEEVLALAKEVGYPLEDIARERGIAL